MSPIYEYKCEACEYEFEELQSSTKKLKKCPKCQALKLERLISRPGTFIFKGDGFYCNMYPKDEKGNSIES